MEHYIKWVILRFPMKQRNLILYIAMSLDGFIASPDGNLSFLSLVAQEGEDYGYHNFTQSVDTIIMGRKTYDHVLAMGYGYPHPGKESYIITRKPRPSTGTISFYTGDLTELISALKNKPGKNIYCDGGAEIVQLLMKAGLIDEFIISIIPVFLGSGIPLFSPGRPETKLELVSSRSFTTGLVQLHYKNKKP